MSYRDDCETLERELSTPQLVKGSPLHYSNAFAEMREANDYNVVTGYGTLAILAFLMAMAAVGAFVFWSTGGLLG